MRNWRFEMPEGPILITCPFPIAADNAKMAAEFLELFTRQILRSEKHLNASDRPVLLNEIERLQDEIQILKLFEKAILAWQEYNDYSDGPGERRTVEQLWNAALEAKKNALEGRGNANS